MVGSCTGLKEWGTEPRVAAAPTVLRGGITQSQDQSWQVQERTLLVGRAERAQRITIATTESHTMNSNLGKDSE